ncbi:hypothetical protein [Sphingomonas gellani]|nr:hypothetical protein [Sphingomonas gellani]
MPSPCHARLNAASTAPPYGVGHGPAGSAMIDNLTILLTHGLMLIAAWRVLRRPDLDREGPAIRRGFRRTPPDA